MPIGTEPYSLLASFQASYADLVRYLSRRTGNAESARDAAHDTWLRVADMARQGQGPALQGESEARAYLFAMARNLVIDQQRRDGVLHRHAASQAPCHPTPDVAEAAMYRQAIVAVEAALAGLPDRARQVFVRNRVHGEDQATLAAEFGVSRNMIERDMMQAMDHVQRALERWGSGAAGASDVDGADPASGIGAAGKPVGVRTGRRRSLAALLGVAGLAVGGLGAVSGWRWWGLAVPQWQHTLATGHGKTLRQPLPDGSALTLDAQTRVSVVFYAGQRSVQLLQGAVFFDVAHEPGRPFVVDVPGKGGAPGRVRITVLGTRFGVERAASGAVQVQVESGRVRVESFDGAGGPLQTHELVPGDGLRTGAGLAASLTRLSAPGAAAGWRHGVVVFDAEPLADVVERLRRYLPRPVEVDGTVAALRLSGQVRISQAEDFVRALPAVVPVRSRLQDGRWRIGAV